MLFISNLPPHQTLYSRSTRDCVCLVHSGHAVYNSTWHRTEALYIYMYIFVEWIGESFISIQVNEINVIFLRVHQDHDVLVCYRVACCHPVVKRCPTLCNPMDCSTPSFLVFHCLLESAQTHVYWVGDTIQPSDSLSPPSPLALNLFQHQSLFQWVSSSHQVAQVLELQLQHQSFQWIFRVDLL